MISWDRINCDITGIEFGNEEQVKLFYLLIRTLGLPSTHDLLTLEGEGLERVRSLNRKFPKALLTKELYTSCIIMKVLHEDQVSLSSLVLNCVLN
jgi:hypothetical protein